MEEVQCEEKKFVKSTNEDVTANEERLKRSDLVIDIVASSIIRLSDTVHNSESVPESVRMNGKTYHVVDNQEERVAELGKLRNCINPDEPLLPNGKKPILLVNPDDSEDSYIYVPIATDAQSPARGIYLKVDKQRKATQPIGSFVTASCLFGSQTLMGIDPDGKYYSLLDTTKNPVPEGITIKKVRTLNDTHIYERAMWEAYETIAHLIKHHRNAKPRVMHLLADVEYFLYGLTYLVGGVFSREAFEQYISAVNVRAALHREKILAIYTRNGIEVNFNFNSPFRNLDLSGKSAKEVIAKFVALFADKGVNTIEDLSCKITLDDLLLKLRATFNYDPAIAALKASNERNKKYLQSEKAKVKAKISDANSEVLFKLSFLDKIGIDLAGINLDLQDNLNPWRLENFEPEVRNLVERKEKHPTPSKMFSIVSSLSEVARVEMSVIENLNERVCVIFESQQERTLKVFKRIFPARDRKFSAYLYQLPIATQDRPLFHEADCTAVTEDLISNISQLYYLNGNAQSVLISKLEKDLTTYNARYDAFLLHYIGAIFNDYRFEYKTSASLLGLIKNNIQLMRAAIHLRKDEITDEKIIVMLSRLARHIVWCKNNNIEKCDDPLEFIYTDGYVDDDYYKNGTKGVIHHRYLWQFSDEGPLLTKEQRLKILIHLPLLDYIESNPSRTTVKFRFCSALMLTFLSMLECYIDDGLAMFDRKAYIENRKLAYYLRLALSKLSLNKEVPLANVFIQKLDFSQYKLDKWYTSQYLNSFSDLDMSKYFTGIAFLNMLNFSSSFNDFLLTYLLAGNFNEIGIGCEEYPYVEHDSGYIIQSDYEKIQIYNNANICYEFLYKTLAPQAKTPPYETYVQDEDHCFKFSVKKVEFHTEVVRNRFDADNFFLNLIKRYTMPTNGKKFSVSWIPCESVTIYINDNGLEYIFLYKEKEKSPYYYVFLKRVDRELALVYVKYSNKDGFTECETPLSNIIKYSKIPQILNPRMRCRTFIQDRSNNKEYILMPGQVLLGIGVDKAYHAYLYAHIFAEDGTVSFARYEISAINISGYCRLHQKVVYSESTREEHITEGLSRFVNNKVEKEVECIGCEALPMLRNISYSEFLNRLKWVTIISMDEYKKMKNCITLKFYTGLTENKEELICPFTTMGQNSLLSSFRYNAQRKNRQNGNMYGEKIPPINCYDFCRDAVFSTDNQAAKETFPANPWILEKIVNYPGYITKTTTVVPGIFVNNKSQGNAHITDVGARQLKL